MSGFNSRIVKRINNRYNGPAQKAAKTMAKKISKIVVKRIPDYDSDLSYLGTFGKDKGRFGIEHSSDPQQYPYFNADNVENMKEARQNYDRIMQYEKGNIMDCGVMAEAEIMTQKEGNDYWKIDHITSGGLWGLSSDSGNQYFQDEAKNQLAELAETLAEFGFSQKEIKQAIKQAVIFPE